MEFNSVNFNINNLANQKAGLVQNDKQQNQAPQQEILPQNQNAQNAQINQALMYDIQAAKMDNETILKYLQNLMNLPNSIDKFVNQLNSKNFDSKLAAILIENMINTKALSEFLNRNSTEAISKLLQTISATLKSGTSDVSQLKEILSILGVIQTSTSINANTLKEFLLLYIPLSTPIFDKNINDEIQDEDEKQTIKNSKLSILFETVNYSNLLISINESENNILIDIFAPIDFPKNELIRIIKSLSKEAGIISNVAFKEKQKNDNKNKIQNFKINSDGYVSLNALIITHLIIKTILKIDNNFA